MANSEHLQRLKQGLTDWNSWREAHSEITPDLSHADLEDVILNGANLSAADLSSSNLNGANLSGANLSGADLSDADLSLADLRTADLSHACLSSAKLESTDLRKADLAHADLGYVDLTFACFVGANLTSANLNEATGDEAQFGNANISYVDLSSATIYKADFSGANLVHSDLNSAGLESSDFSGADLSDTDLNSADFSDSNFSNANLRNAILDGTNLKEANLTGANLTGAKLDGTDLDGAKIGFTIFGNNDLSEVAWLETVEHRGPSTIGIDTVYQSQGVIPEEFLRGAGVSENFITYLASQKGGPLVQRYSCFISFSSRDHQFAEELYGDLRSKRVSCWYAPEDLKLGEKIRIGIDNSIRKYDKLLLVLSKHSIKSDWVEKEVESALEFERKEGRVILLPIRIDDAVLKVEIGWPADIRRTRNIGNFRRWKTPIDYQKALNRLVHDLEVEKSP